jgi:putative ABC transport system permease protein
MAAVLIVYYKQISEGYEDRERYAIMRKVGMERRTVRRSVNSQILVVFFAPLAVAGVHVAFDYSLMCQLLSLFSLYDGGLTLRCTLGTFAAFAAVYALVYRATARTYCRILSDEPES